MQAAADKTVGGQGREGEAEGRTAHFPGVTSTLTEHEIRSLSLSLPPFASIPTRPPAVISIPIGWVWHSFQRPSTRTDAQIMTAMDMNFYSFCPLQIVFQCAHHDIRFHAWACNEWADKADLFAMNLCEAVQRPSNARSPLFGNAPMRNRRKREMDPMRSARIARRKGPSLAVFKASSPKGPSINDVMQIFHIFGPPPPV